MHPHRLFWIAFGLLTAILAALLAGQALLFGWVQGETLALLPLPARAGLVAFLVVAFLSWLPVLAYAVWALIQRYVVPWHRLRESIDSALHAEPGAGIRVEGGADPRGLAGALNELDRRRVLSEARLAEASGRAMEAAERERARLRAMLDHGGACVVACDVQGRVIAYSRGAWERLGSEAGLGLGRPIDHVIDPQLMVFSFDALRKQADSGVLEPGTRFRIDAAGRRWEVLAEPLREENALAGFVLVFEALAERAAPESEAEPPAEPAARPPRAGPGPEAALADLRYVVFDTETTGLHPSLGDEIVAIGAVAVAHGRVVEEERFERLVDPGRPIEPSATRIHGIRAEMLAGCPPPAAVLPELARFAEGAVLVAHNAAFDMRFLRLKEGASGVRFDHPVLDTMLLSAVVHPHQRSHDLDSLIDRYGIARRERHTALGDALMTADALLKLLPQLARRRIRTLGEAQRASRRVPLAGLVY